MAATAEGQHQNPAYGDQALHTLPMPWVRMARGAGFSQPYFGRWARMRDALANTFAAMAFQSTGRGPAGNGRR
jgi:hypothetical protein